MIPNLICSILVGTYAFSQQVYPSVLSALSSDSVEQGLLLTALLIFFPFSAWLSGIVADRKGKPYVLVAGCLFMALPFFLTSVFSGIYPVIACVLFFGIGGGITESQSTALLCDLNPGRERSAVSMSQVFFCAGAMAGPFLIATALRLIPGLQLSTVLVTVGVLVLVAGALLIPLRKLPRAKPVHAEGGGKFVFTREVVLFAVSLFLYVGTEMGVASWVVVYAGQMFDLPITVAPYLLTVFWFGEGASRFIFAYLPPHLSDRTLLLACLAGMLVFLGVALMAGGAVSFGIAVFFLAFAMGGFWPTLVGMAGVSFAANSGTAVGVVVGFGALAASLVQIVIGALSKIPALGLRGALACLIIPVVVNIFLVLRMRDAHRVEG